MACLLWLIAACIDLVSRVENGGGWGWKMGLITTSLLMISGFFLCCLDFLQNFENSTQKASNHQRGWVLKQTLSSKKGFHYDNNRSFVHNSDQLLGFFSESCGHSFKHILFIWFKILKEFNILVLKSSLHNFNFIISICFSLADLLLNVWLLSAFEPVMSEAMMGSNSPEIHRWCISIKSLIIKLFLVRETTQVGRMEQLNMTKNILK